jgi:integrase
MTSRAIGQLTALKVDRARERGMYADGGGLYLRVTPDGTKNWVYRYMLDGRPRWMGLGPLALYGLQEARAKALEARRLRHEGIDPIETRRALRAKARLEAAKAVTFRECAESYVSAHRAAWRNHKHAGQWAMTLKTYADPMIGTLPVQSVGTALVLKVLEPIWTKKPETASRLRQRIEKILDYAKVRGYREGENPASWRGHLDKLLPPTSKVRKVVHHAALPYAELPAFLGQLREQEGAAAQALEFAILTAARTSEVLGARWSEIDLHAKVWIIPAERMKAGREHRVPLSDRALAILKAAKPVNQAVEVGKQVVFVGGKPGRPLSNMAFLMLLRRMKHGDLTAHGFRSTFRDWCAERTNFPSEVAEMALAHAVGDKVEVAYRRGDMFERRRRLMQQWGTFCSVLGNETQSSVAPMRKPS